ncbi:MAG: FAD-dependent oxidoreductase, partial [Acidimicrobiia bacterium]
MATTGTHRYDALVIGAGAGGLCAAARLSHHGFRTLVVESRDRVGGRASSVLEEGFTVNTGAIAIEYGGVLEDTFRTVGAPFEIRVPEPATLFRLKGKNVDISRGGWGKLINGITRTGAGLLSGIGQARTGDLPDEQVSVKAWLSGYTKNKTVHAVFRNLCAAIFAVNSDEMPAKAFLTYFIQKGAFRHFGFSPTGTLGLMHGLAGVVTAGGGDVWLDSPVRHLQVEDGRVAGATVARAGRDVEVRPEVVISNAGPEATVGLCGREHFDAAYLERMDRDLRATANIVVNMASREPLLDMPGIVT